MINIVVKHSRKEYLRKYLKEKNVKKGLSKVKPNIRQKENKRRKKPVDPGEHVPLIIYDRYGKKLCTIGIGESINYQNLLKEKKVVNYG